MNHTAARVCPSLQRNDSSPIFMLTLHIGRRMGSVSSTADHPDRHHPPTCVARLRSTELAVTHGSHGRRLSLLMSCQATFWQTTKARKLSANSSLLDDDRDQLVERWFIREIPVRMFAHPQYRQETHRHVENATDCKFILAAQVLGLWRSHDQASFSTLCGSARTGANKSPRGRKSGHRVVS